MKQLFLKFINSSFYYAFIVFYILFAFLVASLSINLFNVKVFTNKSNSMYPTIKLGSLIVVKKSYEYNVGDIISYYAKINGREEIITHRIFRIGGNVYLTKGDANQAIDEQKVVPRLIIGKVILVIPCLGYPIGFAKTKIGLWSLIVLPALFIIFCEVFKILKNCQHSPKLTILSER